MDFATFIQKNNGKDLDFDGKFGFQCMDLMHFYVVDVLGLPRTELRATTAYEAFVMGSPNFERFYKIDGGLPQRGDIIFWDTSVGFAGHVAVVIKPDIDSFISFDQNWPVGSKCHEQAHDYKGVVGWLRAKINPNEEDMTTEQLQMLENGQKAFEKLQEIENGAKALRQRSTDGALFIDAEVAGKPVSDLEGRIWADSTALAILMRVARIPMIDQAESKNPKYVKVKSARDIPEV